jgi:hypothetical protein
MEIAFVFVWSTVLFFIASAYTRTQYERATDERIEEMKDFVRSFQTRARQIECMLENFDEIKELSKQKGDNSPGFYEGRVYINAQTFDIFELVKTMEFCQQKYNKKRSKK